jgi:hypothetical protein
LAEPILCGVSFQHHGICGTHAGPAVVFVAALFVQQRHAGN